MASRLISDLHPSLQPLCQEFLARCIQVGIKAGISCTYRSSTEQDADYAQGRTAPGKVITNAKGGESPHNCMDSAGRAAAKAFDFFIYAADFRHLDWDAADDRWKKAIAIGEELGLVSGSTFNIVDTDHMEMPNWRTS